MEMVLKEYVKPIIELHEIQVGENGSKSGVSELGYTFEKVFLHSLINFNDSTSED